MSDDSTLIPTSEQPDYEQLVADLRTIIDAGHKRVISTINQEQVTIYWLVGKRIIEEEQKGKERAAYGEQLIERLGRTLTEQYGRGWSERNLQYMRRFYLTYPISHTLRAELGWSQYRQLMNIEDETIREFYTTLAISGRWSSRELEKQIKSMLHLRLAGATDPEKLVRTIVTKPSELPALSEVFKDPYILDFLGLEDTYSEKNLEAALIRNIEKFLLELGTGFCFASRQQRITIDGEDYYIDLVLYHRWLHRLVLVDLKIGKFEHADASQMQLYLEWMKRYGKAPGEEDPIGLILCGSHGEQVVELLEASHKHSMKVSQYLPLKDVEAIKAHLAKMQKAVAQLQEGHLEQENDTTEADT